MAILLIGTTGSGKSTLGNYLIDPSESHMIDHQTFEVANSNDSKTKCVQQKPIDLKLNDSSYFRAQIIDTPGLNEGPEDDLQHMIDVVKAVEEAGDIKACVFVVKFDATIDTQYVETIRYYRNLLPQLFENNVIVVMTKYCLDTKSVRDREHNRINPEEIKQNVLKRVVETGFLSYKPMIFTIDCQAFDEPEEIEASLTTREAILSYIKLQLPSIKVQDLKIYKTQSMKRNDEFYCKKFEDSIKEKTKDVIYNEAADTELAQKIADQEGLIMKTESKMNDVEQQIKEKDTDQLVTIDTYHFEKDWKVLGWVREPVEVKTKVRIVTFCTWTNGRSEWKNTRISTETAGGVKNVFSGSVEAHFMRGIHANAMLLTEKRMMFAQDIAALKKRRDILENEHKQQQERAEEIYQSRVQHKHKIVFLKALINETREIIKDTCCNWMTVADAKNRLDSELKSTKANT